MSRVRSDDHGGTTWAPVGRTPVVVTTGDRFGVNLISAVTAKGKLRFAAYDGSLNGPVFIDFCRRLRHDATGPVFLILGWPPRAPLQGRQAVRRVHEWSTTAVLSARLCARAEPR
jgi:hypothetical protein